MVDPFYNINVPREQFGAVPARGIDFANHLVRTLLDIASALQWSIFVLFLDLVKAFDRVVRELLLGWPSSAGLTKSTRLAYLRSFGLDQEVAGSIYGAWPTT